VRDVHHTRLGVVLLHDVENVAGDQVVRALEVVHDLRHVDAAPALLGLDRLRGDVLTVEAHHRVRDVADRLDVLLGLVADPVEALWGLVRLDLLGAGDVVQLDDEASGGAFLLQLLDRHVLERAGLQLPAAVRRGVHHVQLLAGDLVE